MKKSLLISLLVSFCGYLFSQNTGISDKGISLDQVAVVVLDAVDNDRLMAQSRSQGGKEGSFRFAHQIMTSLSIQEEGTWESLEDGRMLWRLRVRSAGAYSLNIAFEDFRLPSSARMYLYDRARTYVIGPLTQADNDVHEEWWSPIIPFEEVVIEIQVTEEQAPNIKTKIKSVQHDFQGFGALISGSCNIDVICGSEDNLEIVDQFRDLINSVGMFSLNGQDACSGGLINNVRNDCTPYFLTAKHCEVNANNAASVVVYWNYQQSFCRTPGSVESGNAGDGMRNQFNSGSSLIADYDRTDFALLLLDDPIDPAYNAYFAGWDRRGTLVDSALCIHHPQAEEKRISFDFDPLSLYTQEVFARIEDWDMGTTERGSSGAPLFTMSGHIIGQLNGGEAACGNEMYDDFGMLALSWEGGGTSSTRLKDWLDPDGTNVETMGGRGCSDLVVVNPQDISICVLQTREASVGISIQSGYENGVSLSVVEATEGIAATLERDVLNAERPETRINIVLDPLFEGTLGKIVLNVGEGVQIDRIEIELNIDQDEAPAPTPIFPTEGTQKVRYNDQFIWSGTAQSYTLEVFKVLTEGSLDTLLFENLTDTVFPLRILESQTQYLWRIQGVNSCGSGVFSELQSFSTGTISCSISYAEDLPLDISTDLDTVVSSIHIGQEGMIVDVNILDVTGRHTYVGDLIMRVTSPAGTTVELLSFVCDDANDFSISFDDESEIVNRPCPLFSQEPLRPQQMLSVFNGEEARGEWKLTIIDDVRQDGGSFSGWSIELCVMSEEELIILSPSTIELCEKEARETFVIEGQISESLGEVQLSVIDLGGAMVDAVISPNPVSGSGSGLFTILIDKEERYQDGYRLFLISKGITRTDTFNIDFAVLELPGTFALIEPENEMTGVDRTPFFSWESSENVTSYEFILSRDSLFSSVVVDTIVSSLTYTPPQRLENIAEYYWKVNAMGRCEDQLSSVFTFTTDISNTTLDPNLRGVEVFPNPASQQLFIRQLEPFATRTIYYEVITITGQVLMRGNINTAFARIDVGFFSDGLYMLKMKTEDGFWAQPIIKK